MIGRSFAACRSALAFNAAALALPARICGVSGFALAVPGVGCRARRSPLAASARKILASMRREAQLGRPARSRAAGKSRSKAGSNAGNFACRLCRGQRLCGFAREVWRRAFRNAPKTRLGGHQLSRRRDRGGLSVEAVIGAPRMLLTAV
jgi:hypothetical protein